MDVTVRKVETRADQDVFLAFPWKIHADNPVWAPPLVSMRRDVLDQEKNPAWAYLEGDHYIAWRDGEAVGTIAAFVNKQHNDYTGENTAWFGFFESIDDQTVADALIATAIQWARSRGYDTLRGPQSYTTHEETGLLIEGFGRPVLLMTYHPPYYQQLIESQDGFEKVMDLFSLRFDYDEQSVEAMPERQLMAKIVDRIKRQNNVTVRSVSRATRKQDFQLVKDIYNDAWSENWGFAPMTDRELDALVESLGLIFDPRLSAIVEAEGEPVAFMFGVADLNVALQKAYPKPGTPEPLTLLKLVWYWKIRGVVDTFRIPLLGIKASHRNQGIEMLMLNHFFENIKAHQLPYRTIDSGWVLESNTRLLSMMERIGAERYRTYRIYEKSLKPDQG